MPLDLRPYQRESIDALLQYWGDGGGNGLIVIPTGGGKSLVIASLCQQICEAYPEIRIGIVTHVKELISQNAEELLKLWRGAPIGIYSAGVGRKDTRARILFMGIQSVYNKASIVGPFDILLIDEAHLVPRNADTMYGRFISDLRDITPDMRLVGLTATPYRLDSGRLEGKGNLFDDIVYDANVADMIEQGYLSPLISKATLARINIEGLHKRAGDYVQSEMDERARVPTVVEAAVREIVQHGTDRQGWLCFCTSVDHAFQVRDEIRKHGFSCETITGETAAGERDDIIRRYKAKRIRCLTSVGVLTTGFNAPHVDLLALLRPTLSPGLLVQMVGRGFRLAPGKVNCLVLDFAGNIRRHGPVDAINPPRKMGGSKKEKTETDAEPEIKGKECPVCKSIVHYSARECPDCHHQWPPDPPKHAPEADEEAILSKEQEEIFYKVDETAFRRHQKPGQRDSFKATYECGFKSATQWLHFEHFGKMRTRAEIWWKAMGGLDPVPKTVTEALERADAELKWVSEISVRKEGKYFEVVKIRFGEPPSVKPKRVKAEYRQWSYDKPRPKAKVDPERAKLQAKIEALQAKTVANGCTPAEADAARRKAAELIAKYDEVPF